MKKVYGLVGAAALLMSLSAPVLAETDVPNLTCGEFMAKDLVGRQEIARGMILWMNDSANAAAAACVDAVYGCGGGQGEPDKLVQAVEGHCNGQPDATNVIELLKKATE